MTWFKVDDLLEDHPKVLRLGRDKVPAMGVWTLVGTWASRYSTDGFVPAEIVRRHDPRERLARRLVGVGLWITAEIDGVRGYEFHDWTDHQPTAAEVEKKRSQNRERQRKYRERNGRFTPPPTPPGNGVATEPQAEDQRGHAAPVPGHAVTDQSYHASRNALLTASVTSTPTRPDPTRSTTHHSRSATGTQRERFETLAGSAHSPTAHRLIETYAATCRRRPPARVLADLAVQVDELLAQDWPTDDVTRAITAWAAKGTLGPRALHSIANEIANGPQPDENGRHLRPVPAFHDRPINEIPDSEIDPDDVLGPDGWTPIETDDVARMTREQRRQWYADRFAERRTVRVAEARLVMADRRRRRREAEAARGSA